MWKKRLLGAALALVVLSGCGGGPALHGAETGSPGTLQGSVFSVGFDRIADVYLHPVDMGTLTVDGLTGLSRIDDRVRAQRVGDRVEVLAGTAMLADFTAPDPADARSWASITVDAIERVRTVSPALREATAEQIYEAVFNGIIADLDQYSRYVNAERAEQERASRDGYGGIGLLLEMDDELGRAYVEQVFPHSPAARAGIAPGEVFMAVGGDDTLGWPLDQLASRLRGPIGSTVDITLRSGTNSLRTLNLRREQVIVNVVTTRIDDGIAILRVSRFNAATAQQLAEAIVAAQSRLGPGAAGIILDLRGNPGGLLGQSVAVADLFISRGELISTRGRHPDSIQHYYATADDLGSGLPMVVLVDGRSASGAEVAAAALQDSGRAIVVGSSSFGKGSVQTVTRLPNGGELFLTWSRIYSPGGYTLHRQGVMPTICTSAGIEDPDRLIAMFRSGEAVAPSTLSALRSIAADDEDALSRLRAACPWRAHDEELDVTVAQRLLRDRSLYAQALTASAVPTIASAERGRRGSAMADTVQ